jgi:hypothetical protein
MADDARQWLASHGGAAVAGPPDPALGSPVAGVQRVSVRNAWTAPDEDELALFAEPGRVITQTLTGISRHPLHLAALLRSGSCAATTSW